MKNKYMSTYDLELAVLHQYLFLELEIDKCKGGSSGFTDKDCYDFYILCNNIDPYGAKFRVGKCILEHYSMYLSDLTQIKWESIEEREILKEKLDRIFFKSPNHKFIVRVLLKIMQKEIK